MVWNERLAEAIRRASSRAAREGAVNASVAVNIVRDGATTRSSRRQRIVQRNGEIVVSTTSQDTRHTSEEEDQHGSGT